MDKRQLWNFDRPTSTSSEKLHCTPFGLPSNGVISLNADTTITLTQDALFQPECTGSPDIIVTNANSPTSVAGFRDPFYASTIPACYALAAATVIAYMLVIMLLITPRTFLHEGVVLLGRRGFTNGPSGGEAGTGIGGRPWLQKVAALTVAVSLTIATADTFRVAKEQYDIGLMDTQSLQNDVERSVELKVIRIISDTFLWLAQAQTLIRLFPRQREKIIIKWTAFALISLDVLFSSLNNFLYYGNTRPRSFVDAIPALSYLFALALSLLYCAWVIYYSITKRRFAFYHSQMKNIFIVALLALGAILVPVVFFVLDISEPTLAGWGDYIRWVGAAAASVVVWEWVERIEALERNERKDGVLGREVFDGDEMLEVTPSSEFQWPGRRKDDGDGGTGGTATGNNGLSWTGMASIAQRYRPRPPRDVEANGDPDTNNAVSGMHNRTRPPLWPTRPEPTATPFSRTDTASAESTVYAIRYHPISGATPANLPDPSSLNTSRANSIDAIETEVVEDSVEVSQENNPPNHHRTAWQALSKANPFRRKNQAPPKEVSAHTVKRTDATTGHNPTRHWDLRAKLEDLAATHAERFRERSHPTGTNANLPVTVIPAPTRRRDLTRLLEEINAEDQEGSRDSVMRTEQDHQPPLSEESDNVGEMQSRSRLSDPYTPDRINQHSISQRGSVTFATDPPQHRE
ncbi:pH-response regulator protein palH/RIM21 [Xylogone sp. PMI_703]|nr:pH-response regulator protein palH/RIM21 [Xylogone sp. PMI_703]